MNALHNATIKELKAVISSCLNEFCELKIEDMALSTPSADCFDQIEHLFDDDFFQNVENRKIVEKEVVRLDRLYIDLLDLINYRMENTDEEMEVFERDEFDETCFCSNKNYQEEDWIYVVEQIKDNEKHCIYSYDYDSLLILNED